MNTWPAKKKVRCLCHSESLTGFVLNRYNIFGQLGPNRSTFVWKVTVFLFCKRRDLARQAELDWCVKGTAYALRNRRLSLRTKVAD